jgi:arylsulfatase A-like enzyme
VEFDRDSSGSVFQLAQVGLHDGRLLTRKEPGYMKMVSLFVCWISLFLGVFLVSFTSRAELPSARPNVIVIMTDDQGYGDFGFTGNHTIMTPHLDAMAERSGQMTQFYVSPVCAPTRACLMTGRYNYRTRCIDTFVGRAMMDPAEVTMAEVFSKAGYTTGIFGKWHLGDNYPMRPMDQGFDISLVHRGGGIGQPSDPLGAEGKYTDPVLLRNGQSTQFYGYCTDIYFGGALDFVDEAVAEEKPFLVYLPMNCPHGPFDDAPKALYEMYRKKDLSLSQFSNGEGHSLPADTEASLDKRAKIFAMITNIDENVGRLFARLELLDQIDNTIVVFLVDNGPNGRRYVAGMRGAKASVYEGGVRTPFLFHWPAVVSSHAESDRVAAHYDLLPTLMDACQIPSPENLRLDGRSFLSLLTNREVTWPDRYLYIQAHRGDAPVRYHNFLMRNQQWKLLHASGFGKESFDGQAGFELYDLLNDPLEKEDVLRGNPEIFQEMKRSYNEWFDDVSTTRADNYAPPAIFVGDSRENPVVLTRQDWRHTKGRPWGKDSFGHWEIDVRTPGRYEVVIHPKGIQLKGRVTVKVGTAEWSKNLSEASTEAVVPIELTQSGRTQISASFFDGEKVLGPHQLYVRKLN